MAISPREFLVELYEEYLEEASFLYEQRRSLYQHPELSWKKIGQFEERLEAHLDGLVVGGELAIEVCERRVSEGDFGEVFAAVCVFCRRDQRDLVLTVCEKLDPEDAEKADAIGDALKYEFPDAWLPDFLTILNSGEPKLAPVLARAFGYRRFACGPQLLNAMRRCTVKALPEIVWALGRVGHEPAKVALFDYLRSEDEPVRRAAASALVRLGDHRAVDYFIDHANVHSWLTLPLGLAGGHKALAPLIELSERDGEECLIALGLLGDPVSIPFLMNRLEEAGTATALECITGAGLYETVFIPDELDDDEFGSEAAQLIRSEPSDRGDGRPFGSNVTRLSQKPESWNRWWHENSSRFVPGIRYRNGAPYSPAVLIEMLGAAHTSHQLRQFCLDELVTRYSQDFGLETDMPVNHQYAKLAEAAAWGRTNNNRFVAGAWYFAGDRST